MRESEVIAEPPSASSEAAQTSRRDRLGHSFGGDRPRKAEAVVVKALEVDERG